ncbi:MAG: hypothetical protein ACE5IO_06410 [Thermoplasmata archaeon]
MNIREYKPEDLNFILRNLDGRLSKRREDKFKLVEHSDAFFCYGAEEEYATRFVIRKNRRSRYA